MMLCQANFEDLFPDLFPGEAPETEAIRPKGASADCVARWEDDGGRHAVPLPWRRKAIARSRPGRGRPAFAADRPA
jgi:hypothetical protein